MRGLDLGVISSWESSRGEKNNPKGFQGLQREKNKTLMDKQISLQL